MDKDYNEYAKVAVKSDSYKILKANIKQQLEDPALCSAQRTKYASKMAGTPDGKASERIVNYLLENKRP